MDTINREIIIQFLRFAFCKEGMFSLSEYVDWSILIQQAMSHGLDAVTFDGLQTIYDQSTPEEAAALDASLGETKFDWLGFTLQAEQDYERQWNSFVDLSHVMSKEGLRMVVLKGFLLNQCYPNPKHRTSCDIDCFMMEGRKRATDRSAYERANQLMEDQGIKVDRSYFKNSSFNYKGAHVENHQFCTGWRGSKRGKEFELYLLSLLDQAPGFPVIDGSEAVAGPALFNALFMTRHAQIHFMVEEGISLRHICDWGMFLKRYGDELDWSVFMEKCRHFGMDRFAESMTRLAAYVCGVAVGPFVFETGDRVVLTDADRRLLEDTLALGQRERNDGGRLGMAWRILRSRWKFHLFSNQSALTWLWNYVRGYFFDRTPSLN